MTVPNLVAIGCLFSVLICCILVGIAYYRMSQSVSDLNITTDKRRIENRFNEISKDFNTKMKNIEERDD